MSIRFNGKIGDSHLGDNKQYKAPKVEIYDFELKRYKEIEEEYKKTFPKLKALEIIKKKKFNIVDYYYTLDDIKKGYSPKGYTALMLYNLERPKNQQLTQEEFDLLKKELKKCNK